MPSVVYSNRMARGRYPASRLVDDEGKNNKYAAVGRRQRCHNEYSVLVVADVTHICFQRKGHLFVVRPEFSCGVLPL